jgi:putative oxidoreductase
VKSSWFSCPMHDPGRSLNIVRVAVATVLITHPLYAFLHPDNIRGFGHILQSHGLPFGNVFAWVVISVQTVCSAALLARRLILPACVGHIFILAAGIYLIHAPRWRTVGLPDGEDRTGSEFSVLMVACLLGIVWAHRHPADVGSTSRHDAPSVYRGLQVVRLSAALILIIHPLGGISNPAGLDDLGLYFSSIGYPLGVPLVWSMMFLQIACSLALTLQRSVLPACLGHIFVLSVGIWLFHAPHWFAIGPLNVVGPGKEGMEYSVLLITCFSSLLLAYWPRPQHSWSPLEENA